MCATTPTRTQTERADQTRARILDAAVREFSENGLAGARTEQIAEAAGVNKALLYYYFKSKEALYEAALGSIAEGVRATSLAVLDADGSAGERFLRSVLDHFDRIQYASGTSRSVALVARAPLRTGYFRPIASHVPIGDHLTTGAWASWPTCSRQRHHVRYAEDWPPATTSARLAA